MIKPLIIAHRGASFEAPENTIVSIEKAIGLGVDFIEFDVRLSSGGEPFLFHDETTWRTTSCKEKIYLSDLTTAVIRSLDAGAWFGAEYDGHRVPSLEEVLAIDRGPVGLMIEIKEERVDPRAIAEAVCRAIEKRPFREEEGPLLVGSFSAAILKEIHRITPLLPLIAIVEETKELAGFEPLPIHYVAVDAEHITQEIIQELQDRQLTVWTYTVDDTQEAVGLWEKGVVGIITNNPRKIATHFDSLSTHSE